ncbi:MAG: PilX N-terminal domain-containing pilus assembly protein [Betaproteobacteria bacterium]|nr:PilX N-terminal domain-containing pilus assembly protein [Betaproteobacteria bacterium]
MNNFLSFAPQGSALPSRQKGAVLVVGMALLIIITMFALAAIRGITIQERIAGGLYDRQLAFTAAESTLRWAERQFMLNGSTIGSAEFIGTLFEATNDPCAGTGSPADTQACFGAADMKSWWQIKNKGWLTTVPFARFTSGDGAHTSYTADPPMYLAVKLSDGGDCGDAVRINAVGVGRSDHTVVVLESIVCRP